MIKGGPLKLEEDDDDFDEPDWTLEEWLSIERLAIDNDSQARGA